MLRWPCQLSSVLLDNRRTRQVLRCSDLGTFQQRKSHTQKSWIQTWYPQDKDHNQLLDYVEKDPRDHQLCIFLWNSPCKRQKQLSIVIAAFQQHKSRTQNSWI